MRRTLIFVTVIVVFVIPCIILAQNVIQIEAGVNQISGALALANNGDTIELITSGGVYNETARLVPDKDVTIRAAQGLAQKPVWTTDDPARCITLSADLVLDGILFDGSLGASPTEDCIRLDETLLDHNLKVNDCVFQYFDDGNGEGHAIKASSNDRMDSLIVTNSVFQHMMHEHISLKDENPALPPGPCKYLWIENCTFWDSQNEAVYLQSHDNVPAGTPDPFVYINHVTVVGTASKGLYLNQIDGGVIKNSIVINSSTYEYACRIYGLNSSVQGLLYWNCPKAIGLEEGATEAQLTLIQAEVDPMMVDVANGNFTLSPNSPAVGAGVDGATLGDPRWFPDLTAVEDPPTATVTEFSLGQNYPNPFNPKTSITFAVPARVAVKLEIYSLLGQKIATLLDESRDAGIHTVDWNARDQEGQKVTSGIYFCRLHAGDFSEIRRMILLK